MVETAVSSTQRKLLGAFYTASETARSIARIAVGRADEAVLDPCFGGCAFLEAVRSRFVALGSGTPMRTVYGVDVDPVAFNFLRTVRGARKKQFLVRDFLEVVPETFGARFDVVVGNPPFVRHHLLRDEVVDKNQATLSSDLKVPRTADSWLYFFHHSLRFLKAGGCFAMVLPGALLNADYAASARLALATRFASCDMFLVRRRLFADALESPVIVIARGFGRRPEGCRLSVIDSPNDIEASFAANSGTLVDLTERTGPWRLALLPSRSRSVLTALTHRKELVQFGSVATVRIGVVTGANRFFILSESDISKHRLPPSVVRPILSSSKQFSGLDLRAENIKALTRANERIMLLDTVGKKSIRLEAYLASSAAKEARRAFKCRTRSVWHEVSDTRVPAAFLSYVIDRDPRLVLNRTRALCTNAIHRVWWRGRANPAIGEWCALSIASSLGGLSAELYGRICGGGALKLEPTEAAAVWVASASRRSQRLTRAFAAVSAALARDDWERARDIADRAVLRDELGLPANEVAELRYGHDALMELRFSIAARETRRTPRPG